MSCFAVSRLTGRVGRSKKEQSPCLPDLPLPPSPVKQQSPSKRKSSQIVPHVEIVQELPLYPHQGAPPLQHPHHRDASLTPVPPSSPQPSPYPQHYTPYFHYGGGGQNQGVPHPQQSRHMSPHRGHNSGGGGGSVPPSPNLNGMRSPSRQRKSVNQVQYSTLEVRPIFL